MFEHFSEPIASKSKFYLRVLRGLVLNLVVLTLSLGMGMLGYHVFGKLTWIDSFLNASMILTGMGPVNELHSDAAKLFSGFFALYSGLAFLTCMAVLVTPILHRFLHKFHFDPDDDGEES